MSSEINQFLLTPSQIEIKPSNCNHGCYLGRNKRGEEYCMGCGRTMLEIKEAYERKLKRDT